MANRLTSPTFIKTFLKTISSKVLYRAIEVITSPCCNLTGTAEVSCEEDGDYTVTITTDPSIGFLGNGTATVVIDGTSNTGIVTEPTEIFVENVSVTAGTYDVNITLFLPTNSDGTVGVWKSFTIVDVVFPSCV